jgi:hypothetical protein
MTGKGKQPELVDEAILDERAGRTSAVVHLQLPARHLLEPRDLGR